ncbi:unnamed protein product [Protopolystoma xenopodis]|uniref:Uncharacterized protein n=1 Tax=Protopolystoma xenopodis TaxID=117903 RepID=A0A448WRX6_9PLAT|nr:unnamed protein product [Protopolystoma xenopodis]
MEVLPASLRRERQLQPLVFDIGEVILTGTFLDELVRRSPNSADGEEDQRLSGESELEECEERPGDNRSMQKTPELCELKNDKILSK